MPHGATLGCQSRDRERDRTWNVSLYLGLWIERFEIPGLGPNWSIQTKTGVWVNPTRVLSKGCIRDTGAGRQGWLLMTGLLGKSHQELAFAYDSAGCYLGYPLVWGLVCSLRSLLATWPDKMDSEAAPPWSSLAERWTNVLPAICGSLSPLELTHKINHTFQCCKFILL